MLLRDSLHKDFCALVIDVVVGQIQFSESVTLGEELSHLLRTLRGDFVVGECKVAELLILF